MSGGAHDYLCYRIEEEFSENMEDPELNEMIPDLVDLFHDLEWYHSGDISIDRYYQTVLKFKKKWLSNPEPSQRQIEIIDKKIQGLRTELLGMIGVGEIKI